MKILDLKDSQEEEKLYIGKINPYKSLPFVNTKYKIAIKCIDTKAFVKIEDYEEIENFLNNCEILPYYKKTQYI